MKKIKKKHFGLPTSAEHMDLARSVQEIRYNSLRVQANPT